MKTSSNYSGVTVRVPFHYPNEHFNELAALRERFPNVGMEARGATRVVISCDAVSSEATEIYDWALLHLPKS